jgi:putative transposase
VRYACIARHQRDYPVRLMCRVLEVSRAGFYAWRTRTPSARARADEQLKVRVRAFHARSDGSYGAPRVLRDLRDDGVRVGQKRVARLMRQLGLSGRQRRAWVRTTQSDHEYPPAPNLLDRRFAVTDVSAVNRVWVGDVTYVPTQAGWLYLAVVLDLASRRCIGWAMSDTLDTQLTLNALRMALGTRTPEPGLLHHSDRGSQYACDAYRAELARHGIVASMSRRGNCWDNAVAESFFATLELELIIKHRWRTRDDARLAIFRYIEAWYNRHRRHSTLDYVSPVDYEANKELAA